MKISLKSIVFLFDRKLDGEGFAGMVFVDPDEVIEAVGKWSLEVSAFECISLCVCDSGVWWEINSRSGLSSSCLICISRYVWL